MAGKYNRFRLFGSKVPKYLLPLASKTVLSKIISAMADSSTSTRMFFIGNRDDQLFYPIVRSTLDTFNIPKTSLMYIDNTSSQLETALYATELWSQYSDVKSSSFLDPTELARILCTLITTKERMFIKEMVIVPSADI